MKNKTISFSSVGLFFFCILYSLVIVRAVHPANTFKLIPGAKGNLCLKCHESFKMTLESPFLHPLVKMGECTGCHNPHTSSHKNLLVSDVAQLCFGCHKEVLPEKAQSSHSVVVEANCEKCHDSHGSNFKSLLIKPGNELCLDCHKDIGDRIENSRFNHKSIEKQKGCLNCHNPHAVAKSDFLLVKNVPSLCKQCHKTDRTSFARKHGYYDVADANCVSCHNTHGSNERGMLFDAAHTPVARGRCEKCHEKSTSSKSLETRKQGTELCKECHREMVNKVLDKNIVHWPMVDNTGCSNCHDPHGAKQKNLLKRPMEDLCGQCHADTVKLQELSRENPKNPNLCEPVKKGNCTACHSPHASDNHLLMTTSSVSIDLCGECHEWETHSTHPIGEKVIDQRNQNLTVECLSCHKACGTGNKPAMIHFDTVYELCVDCHTERKR